MMERFTLRMPQTLHEELAMLARLEGISLNQYILYALTQKVTAAKLTASPLDITPRQAEVLAGFQPVPPDQVAQQRDSFQRLLARLGLPASDEEVALYLSQREEVEGEPDLQPEAVSRLRQRITQAQAVV